MTLNEYIESLIRLRDHYNAGDYKAVIYDHDFPKPMDGDDFCLNMRTHELEVGFEVISMDTQKFKKE